MIKILGLILIVTCYSALVFANEQRCQSDRYHKMMEYLDLPKDSFSNVKYEDKCDVEYFCVMTTLEKPLKFKKFDLLKGSELRVCHHDSGRSDVNYVNLPKGVKSFEVHNKLFCRDEFGLDYDGNFCNCVLAKDYTYLGYTFPKGSDISMDDDKILRDISIYEDIETNGRKIKKGIYFVNSKTREIRELGKDMDIYRECFRD